MSGENAFSGDSDPALVAEAVVREGYAVVTGAVDGATLAAVKADLDPHLASAHEGHEAFMGTRTRRFGALIAKSRAVQTLLLHPAVLAVADRVLLPHCVRYRLHYTGVMHLEPGERQQVLHRDTGIFPIANPCPPLTLATMWAISDFTRDNGGTRLVAGSHRWPTERVPAAQEVRATEMPAGSVLIYAGNVIHGGGANRTREPRTGVALHYALGWLRQEENQYLAVPADVARALPEEVQALMGYALGSCNLGFVDHIAPGDWLRGVRDPARSDLSPPGMSGQVDALERFHVSHTARGAPRYYDVDAD